MQYQQQSQIFIEANKNATEQNCGEPDYQKCNWTGDFWQQKALEYLKEDRRQTNPFYLYVSYTTPHSGAVGSDKEYGI